MPYKTLHQNTLICFCLKLLFQNMFVFMDDSYVSLFQFVLKAEILAVLVCGLMV